MSGGMELAHKSGAECSIVLRQIIYGTAILLAAIPVLSGHALGAEVPKSGPFPVRDFNTYQPTAKATRIDAAEAPTIDGDLSDPVWAKAQIIDEFYQVDPNPGEPASQRTIARFLYDDNTLYVGIYAYDTEPDKIVATVRARDGRLDTDDGVRIYLDPELTRRNAYYFEMNALGARVDALIQNNATYIDTWNAIWSGGAKRMPDGYSVEMAIPFRDLSFDPSRTDWGLEIQRRVRRSGERIRWSTISGAAYYADISRAGTLTGISDINQGLGLDIQLYGKSAFTREWENLKNGTLERNSLKFVMSGNAYYKLTPGLTGTLTVNPDFSDSPLDIRQVNTTRFVLFQPETRDFFLQDAASFEFGGRGFVRGDNINRAFSRAISASPTGGRSASRPGSNSPAKPKGSASERSALSPTARVRRPTGRCYRLRVSPHRCLRNPNSASFSPMAIPRDLAGTRSRAGTSNTSIRTSRPARCWGRIFITSAAFPTRKATMTRLASPLIIPTNPGAATSTSKS